MFQGSIPPDMRNILNQIVTSWDCADIAVACSGNLTVERVLDESKRFAIHGCDVSIYSCCLGLYFASLPFRLQLRPQYQDTFGWLEVGLDSPAGALATLMLASDFTKGINASGELKNNRYYTRLIDGYQTEWPLLLEKTITRIEAVNLQLASFHAGDATPWLTTLPEDYGVISYPPFFAKGYEVMWRGLDILFDWDKPAFKEIFEAERQQFLDALMNRPYWMFGTSYLIPEYKPFLSGMSMTTNRGVPIHVYASKGDRRIVVPVQKTAPVLNPRLTPGITIGDHIKLSLLTAPQFQALRSQYMNAAIKPAAASAAYAVLVDGLIVGVFAFQMAFDNPLVDANTLYLLSDFAVAPSDYPRLSKLVLYAALSAEAKQLAERVARRRVKHLFTTAFSDNPISMKYRGIFDLVNRKAVDQAGEKKYALNYQAAAGQWSLAQGLATWKQKYVTGAKEELPRAN